MHSERIFTVELNIIIREMFLTVILGKPQVQAGTSGAGRAKTGKCPFPTNPFTLQMVPISLQHAQ
jgi:hypothetical protein